MAVVDTVTQFIKSESNAFSGIWQSKKFSLAFLSATSLGFFADHWADKNSKLAEVSLYCGSAIVCAFIIMQALLEMKAVGQVVPNGDIKTGA